MSSYEQGQRPEAGRLRVRASGVALITEAERGLRLQILRDFEDAMRRGEPQLRRGAGPDPAVANCPAGYDVELLPDGGGFRFTCIQGEECPNGRCHIFTRKDTEDRWTDRGPSWVEREPFPGFVVCGCAG